MKKFITDNKAQILDIGFILVIFIFYTSWMIIQPYNVSPDEVMRYDIPMYIFKNGTLPSGLDASLINNAWGYSYAFFPMLAASISAFFMKIVSYFTMNETALLMAARSVSLLSATGTAFVSLHIGKKLFNKKLAYLFACIIAFLPQNVFMCSYVNNDAFAVLTTALIVYCWILCIEKNWDKKSCIYLGISLSLCILSYYNAYGFVLCSVILYFIANLCVKKEKRDIKKFWANGIAIAFIVFLLAGWWFVRNAIIYDGDFLGMRTCDMVAEIYAAPDYRPSVMNNPQNMGYSLLYMFINQRWLIVTFGSFFGCFGGMSVPLQTWMYIILAGIVAVGLLFMLTDIKNIFRFKDSNGMILKGVFSVTMLIALIIPVVLNVIHSYTIDFQPQGRYMLPMLVPLAYFITLGFKKLLYKNESDYPIFVQGKDIIVNDNSNDSSIQNSKNDIILYIVTALYVITSLCAYFFVYAPLYL